MPPLVIPVRQIRLLGLLLAPDLVMTIAFAAAWWLPGAAIAATPAECRQIMILEGLSVVVGALVGVYPEISLLFLPPIMLVCAWNAGAPSLAVCGFVWYIISTFIDGVRAHRGQFGMARENPDHPQRRLDRRFLLLLATAVILLVMVIGGCPSRWAVCGTFHFGLLCAVDTVLRDAFDRIPQGILRRMRASLPPEVKERIGLCADCVYVQPAIPPTRERPVRCGLSATDPEFPKQPAVPMRTCAGFRGRP